MSRQRHCDACGQWHDLEDPWPEACMGHYRRRKGDQAHQIVRDLQPYRSMHDGSVIDGRAAHREHLKRNGLIEVGNEYDAATKRTPKPMPPVERDIQRAFEVHERGYRPNPMSNKEFDS